MEKILEIIFSYIVPVILSGLISIFLFNRQQKGDAPKSKSQEDNLDSQTILNYQKSVRDLKTDMDTLQSNFDNYKKATTREFEAKDERLIALEKTVGQRDERLAQLETALAKESSEKQELTIKVGELEKEIQNEREKRKTEAQTNKKLLAGVNKLVAQLKRLNVIPEWQPEDPANGKPATGLAEHQGTSN